MNQSMFSRYIKPLLFLAVVIGAVCWKLFHPISLNDWFGIAGGTALAANILLFLYDAWGWQINPRERIPRLAKRYAGTLTYQENGKLLDKQVEFSFVQKRHSVTVETTTDESTSHSITSEIVAEDNAFVLYYTYRTTPFSKVEDGNPTQHGTCRVVIPAQPFAWSRAWILPKAPDQLMAKYWTSRRTCGDIRLQAVSSQNTPGP